jgi:peptide/nickel transport system substrate-binding protein
MHLCETLVTIDEHSSAQLQLAEKLDISKDFRVFTFTLRKGVPFHNGKEMTATDVQKSLERWVRVSPEKARLAGVARMSTPDKYTLVAELKKSEPAWVELLKSPASPMTIIPAEECDKDPNKALPISTGPYQFTDWDGATQLNMRRFKDYAANTAYPGRDGYGGRRTAWFEEATFKVIKEASARVAGLQTGQFHIVDQVPVPASKRLQQDNKIRVYDRIPAGANVIGVNFAKPPTDNLPVRQAIQAVLNIDEIMSVATDGFYKLNPCWIFADNKFYPKDTSKLVYNMGDQDRAKALLKQAGYKGEEIIMLTSADIVGLKEAAVVASEEMKAAGMNVRMDVFDWPGMTARRTDPTTHNLFSSGYGIQPLLGPFEYRRFYSGADNWSYSKPDAVMDQAWDRLFAATNDDDRARIYAEIEYRINQQVYQLKLGDSGVKQASTAALQNFTPYDGVRLWDDWLA